MGRVTYGGTLLEFGGGFDYLVYKGLGIVASLGIAGGQAGAAVFPSLDVSYHFIPKSRRIVPFVMGGVGAISTEGGSSATLNVGGGVNIWSGRSGFITVDVIMRTTSRSSTTIDNGGME